MRKQRVWHALLWQGRGRCAVCFKLPGDTAQFHLTIDKEVAHHFWCGEGEVDTNAWGIVIEFVTGQESDGGDSLPIGIVETDGAAQISMAVSDLGLTESLTFLDMANRVQCVISTFKAHGICNLLNGVTWQDFAREFTSSVGLSRRALAQIVQLGTPEEKNRIQPDHDQILFERDQALAALLRCQDVDAGILPRIFKARPVKYDVDGLVGLLQVQRPTATHDVERNLIEEKLDTIVGQESLKSQIRDLHRTLLLNRRRDEVGAVVTKRDPLHMMFCGGPGCGKTSIALLVAELLRDVGVVQTSKVVCVQRSDLVGGYVGHTAKATRGYINKAKGGILFVDEAYQLTNKTGNDFGPEAVEEIMRDLLTGDPLVILAGYTNEMNEFMKANAGLTRRFPLTFTFPDYSSQELACIFVQKVKNAGYTLADDIGVDDIAGWIEEHTTQESRSKMNGALANKLFADAKRSLDDRLPMDFTKQMAETLDSIDVIAAARVLMK
eukprot:TRINITY_DN88635_c0_g1_i1.p1 TRINITY_DN88635_c0_g1~~TRINITY_DN88635_c0_g1_i1.p1  ORF type:complete len:495 (+),score=60.76 TRINITY_DN88635_c0_g1_i1:171-1655(+)